MNIIQKKSPNFGVGRSGYRPDLIAIHIMAGSLAGTDSWFAAPESQVSSHYGIGFNGEVHQYVQENDTAWCNGRVDNPTSKIVLSRPGVNPNKYTLSIENEGQDLSIVHEAQINAIVELVKAMATKWSIPIDRDHIIGHYEIYSKKPDCPATNKSIIDRIVRQASATQVPPKVSDPIVKIDCPQSKVAKILEIIKII